MGHELAQVNIARLAASLDSPALADFVTALAPVNAAADTAPGFRWRLQDETGNATDIAGFGSEQGEGVIDVITNLSTWQDVASLTAFVYGPIHAAFMRRRREWFVPMRDAYTACWWVPAGHRPAVGEAEDRLRLLRRCGPAQEAFTLRRHFPAPALSA